MVIFSGFWNRVIREEHPCLYRRHVSDIERFWTSYRKWESAAPFNWCMLEYFFKNTCWLCSPYDSWNTQSWLNLKKRALLTLPSSYFLPTSLYTQSMIPKFHPVAMPSYLKTEWTLLLFWLPNILDSGSSHLMLIITWPQLLPWVTKESHSLSSLLSVRPPAVLSLFLYLTMNNNLHWTLCKWFSCGI